MSHGNGWSALRKRGDSNPRSLAGRSLSSCIGKRCDRESSLVDRSRSFSRGRCRHLALPSRLPSAGWSLRPLPCRPGRPTYRWRPAAAPSRKRSSLGLELRGRLSLGTRLSWRGGGPDLGVDPAAGVPSLTAVDRRQWPMNGPSWPVARRTPAAFQVPSRRPGAARPRGRSWAALDAYRTRPTGALPTRGRVVALREVVGMARPHPGDLPARRGREYFLRTRRERTSGSQLSRATGSVRSGVGAWD